MFISKPRSEAMRNLDSMIGLSINTKKISVCKIINYYMNIKGVEKINYSMNLMVVAAGSTRSSGL